MTKDDPHQYIHIYAEAQIQIRKAHRSQIITTQRIIYADDSGTNIPTILKK